jgi:type II secretory pathway component PulF
MPEFSYKARRRSGEVVEGVLDVADRSAALLQIERLGLFPVAVDASKGGAVANNGNARREKFSLAAFMPPTMREAMARKRKPKMQEMGTYTEQLANLLNSGMTLTVALNSMTHLESKGISSDVSRELRREVMEGRSLSDAMSKQPRVFSDLYVNMVRAGEQSGSLVDVLRRMADHFERFAAVQSKFASAMIYPAIVGVVGIGIVIFFMTKLLPTFMTLFQNAKIQLPMSTQMLLGVSHLFSGYWWLMVMVILVAAVLFKRFQASAQGRRKIDEWKMSAPVFGKVMKLNLYGQFARTLSTLLENGVPVLTALKITEQVMPNTIVKEAIAKTREAVTDGKTLAQPLAQGKVFPQLMVDLVKIGEETGNVPGALKNVAETYENELNTALKVMTNLIEPALILVMAAGVGFLLLSVLSAMFSMISNIGGSMSSG